MFSMQWKLSPREHDVQFEKEVFIRMSDGVMLHAHVSRPSSSRQFPALLGVHAYNMGMQTAPSRPLAVQGRNAQAEAGDPQFYVRRGYAQVIVNARGTGRSEGEYSHYGPRDVQDIVEVIAWIAEQSWCSGSVGMFGVSYFSVCAKQVAAKNQPALKALFAPYGYTDFYRDKFYHGGILAHSFLTSWSKQLAGVRVQGWSKENLGEEVYKARLAELKCDRNIMSVPELAAALAAPDAGAHPVILDVLINSDDGPYWWERNPSLKDIKVPIFLGASWDMYFLHLPGEFRAWDQISAPKKLMVGPPVYLDRPLYQYAFESLRWFDHWLKNNDTGFMKEPAVRVFVPGAGNTWKDSSDWPIPQTIWHPFYLHSGGLLSEHEHWPDEGSSSYEDNNFNTRGSLAFMSPPILETTEVIGPITATIYATTDQSELRLFLSLWDLGPDGDSKLLTRGWLLGSKGAVDKERSLDWSWHHPFRSTQKVEPGVIQRYDLNIVPTANTFQKGHRIAVRVSSSDTDPTSTFFDLLGQGHLLQQEPSWVSIHHDADHPSVVHLPVTSGNRIGTFMSGGLGAPRSGATGSGSQGTGWDKW